MTLNCWTIRTSPWLDKTCICWTLATAIDLKILPFVGEKALSPPRGDVRLTGVISIIIAKEAGQQYTMTVCNLSVQISVYMWTTKTILHIFISNVLVAIQNYKQLQATRSSTTMFWPGDLTRREFLSQYFILCFGTLPFVCCDKAWSLPVHFYAAFPPGRLLPSHCASDKVIPAFTALLGSRFPQQNVKV